MRIENWKAINRGAFLGSFDLVISLGAGGPENEMTIRKCSFFEKDGKRWFAFPSQPFEAEGRQKYMPYVTVSKSAKEMMEKALLPQLEVLLKAEPTEPVVLPW